MASQMELILPTHRHFFTWSGRSVSAPVRHKYSFMFLMAENMEQKTNNLLVFVYLHLKTQKYSSGLHEFIIASICNLIVYRVHFIFDS